MKGIYKFENKINHKVYIGQSVNLDSKRDNHIAAKDNVKFHKALQKYGIENFTYTILEMSDNFTAEELDYLEAYYIDMYDSKNKGYNSTKGNHAERINKIIESKMHYVDATMSEEVLRFADVSNLGIDNHRDEILIIGQGEYADYLKFGNNVTIISDSIGYKCKGNNVNIISVNDIKVEYERVFENMKDKQFDLIIANPPYRKIGAQITEYIINNIEFKQFVNLMPANDYIKIKDLWKHVDVNTLKKSDNKFDDASVITYIANIIKEKCNNLSKEEFIIKAFDEKLRKCYETFMSRKHYAIDTFVAPIIKENVNYNYNVEHDFIIHFRVINHGVHFKSYNDYIKNNKNNDVAFDVKWNVIKNVTFKDTPINKATNQCVYAIIRFNTPEEKDNFTKFWYEGKLMNMLLKGTYETVTSSKFALPKVDWTREWTDEEILRDCGYNEDEIKEILK